MKTLYVRLDDEMSGKIETLMSEKSLSSQKVGVHILNSFFSDLSKEKTGIEKAREAVESTKDDLLGKDIDPSHISYALVDFMEGLLEANGG